MLNKLKPKSEFSRNVLTLMTGTTIAQAIPIAISPILTRIYTPEDFGVYSLFISILYILASFITAKYELAIMIPKKDEDAINIFALGFIITFLISILTLIFIIFFSSYLIGFLKNDNIGFWLYFIPISIFFTGIYNILYYFNNRRKNYTDIKNTTILKSIILAIFQLSVGYIKTGPAGLISGQLFSIIFANLKLFKNVFSDKNIISKISILKIYALAKKYRKFPLYVATGSIFDNISRNLTTILISVFYGLTTAGFYSMSKRIMDLPIALAGDSIRQVFFKEFLKQKLDVKDLMIIFLKTLKYLLLIGFVFFSGLYLIVEDLFAFVFGETWRIAGTYTKIMIPLFFIRFVVETIMPIDTVMEKQNYYFIFNLILFLITIILFYFSTNNFIDFLYFYTFLLSIIYLIYGFILYNIVRSHNA